MINKNDILKSIELQGSANENKAIAKQLVGEGLNNILTRSSGLTKIQPHLINKFELILNQPEGLNKLSSFEIRCCLCNRVINYPCWYYNLNFAVNHFHYFVCFNPNSALRVDTTCKR